WIQVQANAAGGHGCKVQSRAAAGIEHGRLCVIALEEAPDRAAAIAMEERLGAAEVLGDVDPVVGLDVAVVVTNPLSPLRLGGEVGACPCHGSVVVTVQ